MPDISLHVAGVICMLTVLICPDNTTVFANRAFDVFLLQQIGAHLVMSLWEYTSHNVFLSSEELVRLHNSNVLVSAASNTSRRHRSQVVC